MTIKRHTKKRKPITSLDIMDSSTQTEIVHDIDSFLKRYRTMPSMIVFDYTVKCAQGIMSYRGIPAMTLVNIIRVHNRPYILL
jgi:hypothetical protein